MQVYCLFLYITAIQYLNFGEPGVYSRLLDCGHVPWVYALMNVVDSGKDNEMLLNVVSRSSPKEEDVNKLCPGGLQIWTLCTNTIVSLSKKKQRKAAYS